MAFIKNGVGENRAKLDVFINNKNAEFVEREENLNLFLKRFFTENLLDFLGEDPSFCHSDLGNLFKKRDEEDNLYVFKLEVRNTTEMDAVLYISTVCK